MVDLSKMTKWDVGKLFDYAILPKNTQEKNIREGCKEARAYNCAAFYSSSPYWTPVVVQELAGSDIHIATGIGFPFGSAPSPVKALETELAVKAGCTCMDMVMNIGALKDKKYDIVKKELIDFKTASGGRLTKVILEVCFLTDDEIKAGCELIKEIGVDYAKSSTGQFEGPTMEQILVMREAVKGSEVKLKVSGVKFPRPQNAYAFILAGAELIGTRSAPEIINALDQMREIGLVPRYTG
ncbi:deoxyribose-phosphate aldolase [Acetobacterium bakii]|uniref:Deoxyribose-phosphate aldolase n=1 Tax=Acetobacterium bakii TaxID=52689 RepID=A0A0L6U2Y0_9FIRM|nr:deoxyribose-phosphate aldolase [Acetobacterium bakii]KNZ42859.1 deoxyribose-phosphate aldolase [Acetobacterium bakii]